MQPPRNLTEAFCRGLRYVDGPYQVRDTRVKGLMVAVNQGSKVWKLQRDLYRDVPGQRQRERVKTVKVTLGAVGDMALDEAGERAQDLIKAIKRGVDPNDRGATAVDSSAWTLGRAYEEYDADLVRRGRSERTRVDMKDRLRRYLALWRDKPLAHIKQSMARAEHVRITGEHGPIAANNVMRDLRRVYNYAISQLDDGGPGLPPNPVGRRFPFNPDTAREGIILPEDMPAWYGRVQALPNRLRANMHLFGLLSGLRPSNLMSIRREWVDLDRHVVAFPGTTMKGRRPFDLPLSTKMEELVQESIVLGDKLFSGTEWLWPAASESGATTNIREERERGGGERKERLLETGHVLRHTWRTQAQSRAQADVTPRAGVRIETSSRSVPSERSHITPRAGVQLGGAVRASPVPFSDAAQRALQRVLDHVGNP
jgi:integrase